MTSQYCTDRFLRVLLKLHLLRSRSWLKAQNYIYR
jgi:hypothetical protein